MATEQGNAGGCLCIKGWRTRVAGCATFFVWEAGWKVGEVKVSCMWRRPRPSWAGVFRPGVRWGGGAVLVLGCFHQARVVEEEVLVRGAAVGAGRECVQGGWSWVRMRW